MRLWAWAALLAMVAVTGCGGGGRVPAAERAALQWTGTQPAKDFFRNIFVLQSTKDFHTACVTPIALTDDDKGAGITGAWCVQVDFLGRVRTFDNAVPPWDEHSISVTVKAQKGEAPAVVSWADCICGAAK